MPSDSTCRPFDKGDTAMRLPAIAVGTKNLLMQGYGGAGITHQDDDNEEHPLLELASEALQQDPVVKRLAALEDEERALPHELLRLRLFSHLEYLPKMIDEGITVEMLPTLGYDELTALGVTPADARALVDELVKFDATHSLRWNMERGRMPPEPVEEGVPPEQR